MSAQTQDEVADTPNAETTVTVVKTVAHPLKSVWNVLLTDEGAEALLGPGARLGDKGHTWQASDGTHGVTRSFHALEQIRFSWHAAGDAPATLVDLHLKAEGDDRTRLELVQSNVPGDADQSWLTSHWTQALDRIDADAL